MIDDFFTEERHKDWQRLSGIQYSLKDRVSDITINLWKRICKYLCIHKWHDFNDEGKVLLSVCEKCHKIKR